MSTLDRIEARQLERPAAGPAQRIQADQDIAWLVSRVRQLEAVERAARDLLPFLPADYAGVPLANLRHALAALAGGEQ